MQKARPALVQAGKAQRNGLKQMDTEFILQRSQEGVWDKEATRIAGGFVPLEFYERSHDRQPREG